MQRRGHRARAASLPHGLPAGSEGHGQDLLANPFCCQQGYSQPQRVVSSTEPKKIMLQITAWHGEKNKHMAMLKAMCMQQTGLT